MKTLRDTIYQITLPTPYAVGDVHCYLLKGDKLTLVDTGVKTEEAWNGLKKQLSDLGYLPKDIEQIIYTHHHPDHMGLLEPFENVSMVAAHEKLKPWLERDEDFFQRYEGFYQEMYEEAGVPDPYFKLLKSLRKPLKWTARGELTQVLSEGDLLPGHEEWVTIETPGHAQSHLSFFRSSDGALIGGDHLLPHISSNPLLEPPFNPGEARPAPLLQYRESMIKLRDYPIGTVFPGHGKIFEDVRPLITRRLERQEERAQKVKEMIGLGKATIYQVCQQLFPKQIETQFGLTMSETVGQLDYLEATGQVDFSMIGKQKYYYVNKGDGNEY